MAIDTSCLALRRLLCPPFLIATSALLGACASTDAAHDDGWAPIVVGDSGLVGGGATGGGSPGPGLPGGGTTGGGTTGGGFLDGAAIGTGGTGGAGLPGGYAGGGTTGGAYDAGPGPFEAGVFLDTGLAGGGAGFPRSGEALNVDLVGPYATADYEGPFNPVFESSRIYYPVNAIPPFAIVALSPGFTNVKENVLWWGPVLASHGFAVAVLSPTLSLDFPEERADDLEACIAMLASEHTRAGSPLLGKIEGSRAGLLGHSMGGGAVLLVQNRAGSRYRAAVAWEPWETSLNTSQVATPTLILTGEEDIVAGPRDMGWPFYQQIPAAATKAYAEFVAVGHYGANDMGEPDEHQLHAKWTIAWLKQHLEDDTRYDAYIQNGPELARFGRAP